MPQFDEQNSAPRPEPSRELVVRPNGLVQSRQLVVSSVSAIAPGTKLGCTVKTFSRYVLKHRLDVDTVEIMLAARRDYEAGIPQMVKFYARGIPISQINLAYGMREAIKINHGNCGGTPPSVAILLRVLRAFGLDDLEPDIEPERLAEIVTDAHAEVKQAYGWIKTLADSLGVLLAVAASDPGISLGAAVSLVGENGPGRDSEDDESDE